jgi:TolA-binding protein
MSRQINLYSSAFKRQAKPFTAVWTVAVVAVIAAGLLANYVWEARQLQDLRARRSEAGAQLKQMQEQLVALGKTVQKTSNKTLEAQVVQLETQLRSRQELFGRLQSGEFGNRDGYATFLAALARQRVTGVWLTGIEISGPGSEFALEGRAVRGDLLPSFIKLLGNEDVLRGKPVATLALHERQIDPKGEPEGGAFGTPVQGVQGVQQPAQAEPRSGVRVVEFRIGTGAASGTVGSGPVAGAGGTGR